jgi:hypothetical protein
VASIELYSVLPVSAVLASMPSETVDAAPMRRRRPSSARPVDRKRPSYEVMVSRPQSMNHG